MHRRLLLTLAWVLASASSAAEQFIPVINGTVGERRFTTTVEIQNLTTSEVTCQFEYRSPNQPDRPLVARESVPAGKSLVSEDFLGQIPTASTIRVRCSSPDVRVFSRIQDGTRAGDLAAGRLFRVFAATPAQRGRTVSFATNSDVVIAEVTGRQIEVAFTARNEGDVVFAEKTYTLLPYEQRIIDLTDVLAAVTEPTVELLVLSGEGGLVAGRATRDATLAAVAVRLSPDALARFEAHQQQLAQAQGAEARSSITAQLLISPFKAAPFRDLATGLVFMRDRWYDPSTGSFLTPDRMGYVDSSNPYAFAGGDPVNKSDPTGMYQADIHFGMTYFLAKQAGFCDDVAKRIATGAEFPDQDPGRAPVQQWKIAASPRSDTAEQARAQDMLQQWHFPKPRRNSGVVVPGSPEAQQIIWQGYARGNLWEFAQGIHPLQDSWSHRGQPSWKGVAGHPKERGGLTSTKTDQPWRWPVQAVEASQATFNYLLAYRSRYPQQRGPCAPSAPAKWATIQKDVEAFVRLRTKADKKAWLARYGITMPDYLWEDVDE